MSAVVLHPSVTLAVIFRRGKPHRVIVPVIRVRHLATVRAIARVAAGLPAKNSHIRQDQSVEQSKAPNTLQRV